MRAAAVQLQQTNDMDRNLEAADRLTRAAAADGAELVVLPERLDLRGSARDYGERAEPLDGRPIEWARRTAGELGIDLVAGSIAERREGHEQARQHVRPRRPRRRGQGGLPQDPHVRRGGRRRRVPRVRALRARRRDRAVRDRRRHRARPDHLLRPALPRAVPDPRPARRPHRHRPGELHAGHRRGPLGGAAARPGDREPGLRDRARPGPRRRPRGRQLRQLDDRRPLGRGARPRRRRGRGRRRRRPRPGAPGRDPGEAAQPGQPRARPPTAGPRRRGV